MASVVPLKAQAATPLPLGLAAGAKEAQITLDGKHWATLESSSSPIYDGTTIRTGNGIASALLKDGTQLEIQPRSLIGIHGSRTTPVVKIAVGLVLFRLPPSSTTVLVTPGVRYEVGASGPAKSPAVTRVAAADPHSSDQVGEILVTQRGGSRIALLQGEMRARPASDPGLHVIKTGQSLYIPLVNASDPSFKALLAQALPAEAPGQPTGATPLYDQAGRSIGYCRLDGSFISSPGITHSLRSHVEAIKIPPGISIPTGVPVVFTADPTYAGYFLGNELIEHDPPRCDCPIPLYDQAGGSIGYLDGDGSFVFSPSVTPDLTTPVSARKIPSGLTIPSDAKAVFTVEPAYIGYLLRGNRLTLAVPLRCRIPSPILAVAGAAASLGGVAGAAASLAGTGIGFAVTGLALAAGGAVAVSISNQGATASQFTP